MRDKIILSKI